MYLFPRVMCIICIPIIYLLTSLPIIMANYSGSRLSLQREEEEGLMKRFLIILINANLHPLKKYPELSVGIFLNAEYQESQLVKYSCFLKNSKYTVQPSFQN